ncbi:Wzz/FepE/Etk N-terminal domain-containing protein [Catellatospora tritici]|uniref:Wzz/FepE/Etk N-terminal domain-containing protein n=1 Tax=Catellatospora tritici TaxID=2851566 RepID=UPI001C2CE90B|nr:Wzz/FepE/Etk N-terminal domain-containing protein [Catellatospora tritici]MBV1853482.1 lipopolysaccharide biosynthesis protein [Catellatospora tritici]
MATNSPSVQTASIGDYVGWLVRRWWLVAFTVFLGGVGGLVVAAVQEKVYISETKVLVMQVGLDTSVKVNLDTESQVVSSTTVAESAQHLLASSTPVNELVERVSVTVPANTSVLAIAFEAPTAEEAQAGSQAFAQAYLDQRAADANKSLDVQIASLKDEISTATKSLNEVAGRIAALAGNSVDKQQAIQQQQILTQQISTLNNRLIPLLAAVVKPGSILSAATKPDSPAKPDMKLYLISGIGIGLLLGLAGALVVDRLDSRIYNSRQLPYRVDVPILMELQRGRDKIAVADAASHLGREFSLLRNTLRVAAGTARGGRPSPTDALLICGAARGGAVEFVVANLAAAFARSGERVVVVSTDPQSFLPGMLGVNASVGLGDVIAGTADLDRALTKVPTMHNVTLLTPGHLDPRVELPVAVVSQLLVELQERADRVLLATAPPSSAVDAQAMSEIAAAVLLVVETRAARMEDVESSIEQISRVQGALAGLLVVRNPRAARNSRKFRQPAPVPAQLTAPAAVKLPTVRDHDMTMVMDRVPAASEEFEPIAFWQPGADESDTQAVGNSRSGTGQSSADAR